MTGSDTFQLTSWELREFLMRAAASGNPMDFSVDFSEPRNRQEGSESRELPTH